MDIFFFIFGPVLVVLNFHTPKEAIVLANNTRFRLAASMWTESLALALVDSLSIKAGACWVNAHNLFDAGFGGYRESGFGRDGGKEVGSMDHTRTYVCQLCCALIRGCTSTLSQPGKPDPTQL